LFLQGRVSGGNGVGTMSHMTSVCWRLNVGSDAAVSLDSLCIMY